MGPSTARARLATTVRATVWRGVLGSLTPVPSPPPSDRERLARWGWSAYGQSFIKDLFIGSPQRVGTFKVVAVGSKEFSSQAGSAHLV